MPRAATASKLEDACGRAAAAVPTGGGVPAAAAAGALLEALSGEKRRDKEMRDKRDVVANAKRKNVGGKAFRIS